MNPQVYITNRFLSRGVFVGIGIAYAFRNENKYVISETFLAVIVPLHYIGYKAYVNICDFIYKN